MLNRNTLRRPLPVVAVGVLAVALIGGGTAAAQDFVISKDVKDNSLRSVDVKDGSLRVKDLTAAAVKTLQKGGPQGAKGDTGATGATGPKGDTGPQGPKGADATYVGAHWSIIDRNVEGNGASYLRPGPDQAPLGQGSLGLRTAGGTDKAAFGNQVDFAGQALGSVTEIGFSVFTTGENIGRSSTSPNMPSIAIEVDPTGTGDTTGPNYSTLVFIPKNTMPGWASIDATDSATGFQGGGWYYTGAAGTASNCTQTTFCTFARAKAAFPSASILTVGVTKGRDFAFSGAVDALRLNDKVFDFEPLGVYTRQP